jgi:hypothetical protein
MNASDIFGGMIEEKLLNLHTAFIAKVVSVQGESKCTIQPLDKIKAYGQKAKTQAVITNVPVLSHVRHYGRNGEGITLSPLRKGDIVFCVCAERDITSAVKGHSTTPPVGHHAIKDAVVVGLIGG